MNAREYLNLNPTFYETTPPENGAWLDSFTRALDHTAQTGKERTISNKRPGEDEHILKYRSKNIRYITREGPDKFKAVVSRTLAGDGLEFRDGTVSDRLAEFFESKPYTYLSQPSGLREYIHKCAFPESLRDSNALLMSIPYDPEDPETPPTLTQLPSERFNKAIHTFIIPSSHRRETNNHIVSWEAFDKVVRKLNGDTKEKEYTYYWVGDKEWFYRLLPVRRDPKTNKVIYELEEWYKHDSGEVPINILPGRVTSDEGGNKYKVPVIYSFYQYADEFDARFSDNQAVDTRFAHPKEITVPIECGHIEHYGPMKSKCVQGNIRKYIKEDGSYIPSDLTSCPHCKGTGLEPDVGIMNRLSIARKNAIDGEIREPFKYVNPDIGVLEHSFQNPFKLLEMGFWSIGLNLVGSASESGEAKKLRLKIQEDIIRETLFELKNLIERHSWLIECIYQPNESVRVRPVVKMPTSLQIKDVDMLEEDAKNALPSYKLSSNLDIIRRKFGNDPKMFKVHKLVLFYSPLAVMENEDIELRINNPAIGYSENDLIKLDNAERVFLELSEEDSFMEASQSDLFAKADEMIEPLLTPAFIPTAQPEGNGNITATA